MQRRSFLKTSVLGAAALSGLNTAGLSSSLYAAGQEKIYRVGLIGAGWYGKNDLFRMLQVANVEVAGICDVDSVMLERAIDMTAVRQKSGAKPKGYGDFREMLKAEPFDIVLVGTPDHWHALAMIEAVKAGADVYVQKPVGVDFVEGEAMVAAARKHDRIVQVGTQRRSTPHLLDAKKQIIDEGLLGKISHVDVVCFYHMRARQKPTTATPPANLNYEMWAGPAPMIPYQPIIHPRSWRAFKEYGNGIMGDMCVHFLDFVRYLLGLGWPKQVSATGGIYVDKASVANIPDTQSALFTYDDLTINWTMRSWGAAADKDYPWGAIIYGDKGTLKMSVNSWDFIPVGGNGKPMRGTAVIEELTEHEKSEPDLEKPVTVATRAHHRNFVQSVQSRQLPVADILQGHISSATCILGNLAMDLGRTLTLDPQTGRPVGDEQTTKLLMRPYRAPWVHPTAEKF